MFVQSNMFNNGRIGAKVKKLRFTPAQVELFDKKMLNTWLWNRVSSKQTKINFGSNRNKPKQDLFRVCFGLFRETKNKIFWFVSVFRIYIKTTETNRNKPKRFSTEHLQLQPGLQSCRQTRPGASQSSCRQTHTGAAKILADRHVQVQHKALVGRHIQVQHKTLVARHVHVKHKALVDRHAGVAQKPV
jgi:hypothetical protein